MSLLVPLGAQTLALVVAVFVVMHFRRLVAFERARNAECHRLHREDEEKHQRQVEILEFRADLAEHGLRAILEGGALNHTTVNSYEPRTPCDCQACKALHNVKVVFKLGEFAPPKGTGYKPVALATKAGRCPKTWNAEGVRVRCRFDEGHDGACRTNEGMG